MTKEQFLYINW